MSDRRKRLVNREMFASSKRIRKKVLGGLCELCQLREATLGHHTRYLGCNAWWAISLRCQLCEAEAHKLDRKGNPAFAKRIHEENNEKIRQFFNQPPA